MRLRALVGEYANPGYPARGERIASVWYSADMRFNVRSLLLYVMPCIAIAATVWVSSELNAPPSNRRAFQDAEGLMLTRLILCAALPCWWILIAWLATNVWMVSRGERGDA